jgi:hypothetical protein
VNSFEIYDPLAANQSLINNVRSSSVLRFIRKRESRGGKKVKEKLKNDRYGISTIISDRDEQNYANPQHKHHVPTRNSTNLLRLKHKDESTFAANDTEFVPGLILSNVMSLVPKIDELQASLSSCFTSTDTICITETWSNDRISDSIVNLPGFSIIRKDRLEYSHGGVCAYIKDGIEFKRLTEIESADHEVLWVEIKPKRLPRKINKLVCGVLYHPPSANDERMKSYLFSGLQKIESNHPNCGIVLAGDFNRLNIANICRHYSLK